MEVFSFWKNTHIAQPGSSVNFGPNACLSRGRTNQGLCVIHGMSVIDFSHIYILQMMQPHAKPSECLHANFGVQVCKHYPRVLARVLMGHGPPSDAKMA